MKKIIAIIGVVLLAVFAGIGIYAYNNDMLPAHEED